MKSISKWAFTSVLFQCVWGQHTWVCVGFYCEHITFKLVLEANSLGKGEHTTRKPPCSVEVSPLTSTMLTPPSFFFMLKHCVSAEIFKWHNNDLQVICVWRDMDRKTEH